MDFRVKKLILEEGMKNIAETEGVKLNMNFDDFHKTVEVEFEMLPSAGYSYAYVKHTCSYASIQNPHVDVFTTIEKTRQEVRDKKRPTITGFKEYSRNDIRHTAELFTALRESVARKSSNLPKIKKVIFSNPATIVMWADGDKTVVKCQPGDVFDAEKGLAMAIVKKAYGGKGNYCEVLKPWIEKYNKERKEVLAAWSKGMREAIHEVLGVPDVSDAVKDIQDILEGKVDPMMIEKDEEEPKSIKKHCTTCKHEDVGYDGKPCYECLTANEDVSKWEPKE